MIGNHMKRTLFRPLQVKCKLTNQRQREAEWETALLLNHGVERSHGSIGDTCREPSREPSREPHGENTLRFPGRGIKDTSFTPEASFICVYVASCCHPALRDCDDCDDCRLCKTVEKALGL